MKKIFPLLLLCCALLAAIQARAQITITNFRSTSSSPVIIYEPGVSASGFSGSFQATITRNVGTVISDPYLFYVYVVAAPTANPDAPNNVTISSVTLPSTWTANGTGRESGIITGNFFLNYNNTSNGTKSKMELLYRRGTVVAVSNTTDFEIRRICTNGTANGEGNNICQSQIVPFTSSPAVLSGQNRQLTNMVYRWEYNYRYPADDWHTISGAEGQNFQPWDCWQPVHYRRVILYEYTNIWGQKYHEHGSNSNPVSIIPNTLIADGVYKLRNRRSNQLLEIGGGGSASLTSGTRANQWPATGTANQEWVISATGNGRYKILNRNSGQALEIGGGNEAQPEGAGANQWPYWGGLKQQWVIMPMYGQGYVSIVSANSAQVLEIGGGSPTNTQPGAQANQWPYQDENHYQSQWELIPVSVPTSARFPGVYTIQNVNSTHVLEIGGAAVDGGETSQQGPYGGTSNQQWTLVETDLGYFKIINRNSGLALDVSGAGTNGGEPVIQWPYGGGQHQQWSVDEVSPGVYKLLNRYSGQALEIGGAATQQGAAANQWPYWGNPNQQWTLTLVSQNRPATQSGTTSVAKSGERAVLPALSVYPNPTSTALHLALPGNVNIKSVTVSDLRGAAVPAARRQHTNEVDVSALPAGTYLVNLVTDQGNYHQKFVKQ
jgi:hypothetical protein